jgi:hypothetical protein
LLPRRPRSRAHGRGTTPPRDGNPPPIDAGPWNVRPFGLAGPVQAIAPFQQRLEAREGAFDLRRYDNQASAREAIEDREVYGAVVAAPDGLTLLTGSAASPTLAGLLRENLSGPRVKVEDVVPADPDDTRGAAFSSMVLPLVVAGIIAGAIITLLGRPGLGAIGILVAVAPSRGR